MSPDRAGANAERKLVLGPRKCGKSEAAERELARFPHLLYVGTLWNDEASEETILLHQVRRGDCWKLIEVTGSLEDDARAVASWLAGTERPAAVLVDGLTTWAVRNALTRGRLMESALKLAHVLVFLVNRFPDVGWCWIDVRDDSILIEGESVLDCSEAIWNCLQSGVSELTVEVWTHNGPQFG